MTKILPVLEILFVLSMYVKGVYHELGTVEHSTTASLGTEESDRYREV